MPTPPESLALRELKWWKDEHGKVRVMAIMEGYVMARRPRAAPFVMREIDFYDKFTPFDQ